MSSVIEKFKQENLKVCEQIELLDEVKSKLSRYPLEKLKDSLTREDSQREM
jgi:hypothetical protein